MRHLNRASLTAIGLAACLLGCATTRATAPAAKDTREALESRLIHARDQLGAKDTHDQAEAELTRLVNELKAQAEAEPKEAWPHLLLGRASLYLNKPEEGRAEMDAAAKLAPDEAEVVFYQGYLHRLTGDTVGAKPLLERAVSLAPNNPLPMEDLGELLLDEEHPDQAIVWLQKACALPDASPYAFLLLGSAQRDLEKYDEALVNYQKAAEMAPDQPEPHYYAGQEFQLKGQYALARPHFEAVAKLDPENPVAWAKLVQIYQSLGETPLRDQARTKVIELSRGGNEKMRDFGLEQFAFGEFWVFASEMFEAKPPFNVLYEFAVLPNSHSNKPVIIFSLESADFDQAYARERGMPADERVYTLDSVVPGKSHATYEFFHRKPSYEEVRDLVVAALKGELTPGSMSTYEEGKPEEKPTGEQTQTH